MQSVSPFKSEPFFSIFLVKSNKYVVQNSRIFTNFYVFLIFAHFFRQIKVVNG